MISLTLKQFRYFEAVMQHRHFGRASESCGISQPALSMQIKELETTLGAQLFERGARDVRVTRFGEEFALRVRDILRGVDELGDLARVYGQALSGRLRLGIIPTIAPYLLPAVIGQLNDAFPEIELHVRETLTPKLLADLAAGRLDMAILALPISDPAFTETPLFEEEFVLVRPECDAERPVPDGQTLAQMQLLLLEEGHCFRDQALSFCNPKKALPHKGLEGSTLSTLVQMVGAGIGVTLIPDMAVPVETRSAAVSVSHFQDPKPKRSIGMIWRKTTPLSAQFGQVAELVKTAAMPTERQQIKRMDRW